MPTVITKEFAFNQDWPQVQENARDPIAEYLRLVIQAYHYSVQNPW